MTAPGAPFGPAGGLPPVGDLAQEAAQLLDAVAARLAQVRLSVAEHLPVDRTDNAPADGRGSDGDPHSDNHRGNDGPEGDADADGHRGPDGAVTSAAGQHRCIAWCPVCRSADLLRGDRPEVAGKLVDSALVVIGALRSLLPASPPTPGAPTPGAPTPGTSATGHPASGGSTDRPTTPSGDGPTPSPGIERIDIR